MARAAADLLSRIPLAQLLAEKPSLSLQERLELARELARELAVLHRSGRVHRAISLDEVAVDPSFRPTLPEPPASRHFGGDDSDPEFCPPELTGGSGVTLPAEIAAAAKALEAAGYPLDPRRIDVYQLGALMCQILTGQPVLCYIYDATTKTQVPAIARTLLERTLGVDSTERFQTCEQLIEAMDAALQEVATSSHETPARGSFIVAGGDTPPKGVGAARDSSGGEPLPFERLGHYRIISQIGRGGMGDVYRGYDETLQRDVAIKVLPAQLARDADFVRRFRAEATAAASIAHPNVAPIYYIGEDAGHHYFVMQYVDGESLAERLDRQGRFRMDEAIELIGQCLAGLQAAHARGLIHRDIKPGNILLERASGRAMLVDFGLVRRLDDSDRMTATGVIMGTVDYISPEQARGRKVDARSDIYSLGVLLYQLLAGRMPFSADSPTAMIFQHAYEKPFPLKEAAADVPTPLVEIVARMMAKDPDDRYADCAAVMADIEAFQAGRPLPSPSGRGAGGEGIEDDDEINDALPFSEPSFASSDRPWQRARDWAATIFRRHAPEFIQELQTTTQQADAAVAQYQRRRDRLASLLNEAQTIEADLAEQIRANEAVLSAATSRTNFVTLRECEEHLVALRPQYAAQRQQVEDLQQQLTKADATLARLRSQQDILKTRLHAAAARHQTEGGPRPRAWSPRLIALVALGCFMGLICLILMLVSSRPMQVEHATELPPAPGVVDLAGLWQMTLPNGMKRSVVILNLGRNRYLLRSGGNTGGMYELRGDRLEVLEPNDKRLTEFVWQVQDSNAMVLIESPPVAKVGSDYRGAVLERNMNRISPTAPSFVTEGAGWGDFRVGATREELIDRFGPPEVNPDPQNQWQRWLSQYHVDCLIDNVRGVYELRFNKGFTLPLASGIRIGSSEHEVVLAYGTPDRVVTKSQSKMLQYSARGLLMWIANGVVYDFTVFKPQPLRTNGMSFAYDALLNDEQCSYRDWTEATFKSFFKAPDWNGLASEERSFKEEELLEQLSSDDSGLRIAAINALAITRDKRAIPGLLHIAAERVQKANRDRWMAVRALGFLGDTSVVPDLVYLTYHYNKNTRMWAQISLVRLTGENFTDDVAAWRRWWRARGGSPPIVEQRVAWSTSDSVPNPSDLTDAIAVGAGRKKVDFVIGPNHFQPGDKIVIEEVRSELGSLDKGDTVTVKGTYTLASRSKATLSFYITQASRDEPSDNHPGVHQRLQAGSGAFELTRRITAKGALHISFYPENGGSGFGGVYFGTYAQMQEIAHWKIADWNSGSPVAAEANAGYRIGLSCEDGAATPATLKLKGVHGTELKSWPIQIPTTFELNASDWPPDNYYLYASAKGYATQNINLPISHDSTDGKYRAVTLYRKRYVVIRYACNRDGSRDLSPEKTEQGRVAVAHWGQIAALRGDWQIWQKGPIPQLEFHRQGPGFGFAKPPVGATFDEMLEAPPNDKYVTASMPATPGLLLYARNHGNNTGDQCYAKIEVQEITERLPANVEVVEGRN